MTSAGTTPSATPSTKPFLDGKTALICGIAGARSIAWGVARAMTRAGCEVIFSCQNEKIARRIQKLADEIACELIVPCDVTRDDQLDALFDTVAGARARLDIIVHSLAFAPREALEGGFTDATNRDAFAMAHAISAYSMIALTARARPLMPGGGAALTLSYLGAERAVPHYNVMGPAKASLEACVRYLAADLGPAGVRVNGISAGPIRTPAAAGIAGFRNMLSQAARIAPLRRGVDIDEVGNVAAFLCSDLASGVTGEIVHVDAGFNIVGMAGDAP